MSVLSGAVVSEDRPGPAGAYLQRQADGDGRCRWPLLGEHATIGRAPTVDVVVSDMLVSRVHVTLERVAGVWTVVDDGLSRNGTFVNGKRLTGRLQLRDRDTIRVGETLLTYCAPGAEAGPHTLVSGPLPSPDRLTVTQRAVLVALCRPLLSRAGTAPASNRHVAEELFLSQDAVKAHLRALFHTFGVDHLPQNEKRACLADMALRYGLVSRHDL